MITFRQIILEAAHEASQASQEAHRRGLSYIGFGRYADRSGNVKYVVQGGRLVPFTEKQKSSHEFAARAHEGQTRSDKTPYIEHPTRVAEIVRKYKSSKSIDDLISAAHLHDTIEDTETTEADIKKLFGGLVASLVKELTSDKEKVKEVGKTQYLLNKMSKMSSYGLVIKLADRLDNVSDLKTAKNENWRAKYKKETEDILNQLEKNRTLSATHKKLIDAIREKLNEAG